ncbi:thiamine monophosphate synthase [Novosphingobium sp. Rr 2-17]|nr:thiamine monophosphate synthase [Novosphingobium sp. Rr 2-17]
MAHACGHWVVLSGSAMQARLWSADGAYGSAAALTKGPATTRLVTAHSLRDIAQAKRADAIMLSPVFPTRSHPGAAPLGPARFRLLSTHSRLPVIALGGMTARRAHAYGITRWAAIDGLATASTAMFPVYS